MTKRIKDFGVPIEGRRKGRKRRSLAKSMKRNREDDSINLDNAYHGANKVKEAQGIYSTEEEQARKPWGRKMQYQVPKLSSVSRTGPDYLPGGRHADEDDFKSLGIRGVEFGACLSDEEAQSFMDECYVAFCDLARVLGIDKKDVSLGGTLSLAFGARGHGGSGPATYNPKYHVINFTKDGGAGSLAHEWAHALDYYVGKICRPGSGETDYPISGCPGMEGVPPSVTTLLRRTVSRREAVTHEEQVSMMEERRNQRIRKEEASCKEMLQSIAPKNLTDEQKRRWNQVVQEVYDTRKYADLDMYVVRHCHNWAIEELSKLHKEITGHVIPKDKKRRLNSAFVFLTWAERIPIDSQELKWREQHTEFYTNSWEMDGRYARTVHGRYSDNCERLASAFECYVADKLKEEGNQSQYLTAHSEDVIFVKENGEKVYGGPMGKEREECNRGFDLVFWELKELGVLHWKGPENIPGAADRGKGKRVRQASSFSGNSR